MTKWYSVIDSPSNETGSTSEPLWSLCSVLGKTHFTLRVSLFTPELV